MKMYYTTNSPFVRKVRIVASERRLDSHIDLIAANPWAADNPVQSVNPVGKIPTLVLDTGDALYDSQVICEYLDTLGSGPSLFPVQGNERWTALRRSALGNATMEAMISRRLESRRSDGERSHSWMERQRSIVNRCLDAMESEVDSLEDALTIGHVTWICALAHLDFRFGDEPWRVSRPKLSTWYRAQERRESVQSTMPFD
jgi:glutathione S-transferase